MQKKPWYKSKIALLGVLMGLIGASDLAFGWLTGNGVTSEQIQVIQATLPDAAQNVKEAVKGNNYFGVITAVGGFLGSIWRIWFTNTQIG